MGTAALRQLLGSFSAPGTKYREPCIIHVGAIGPLARRFDLPTAANIRSSATGGQVMSPRWNGASRRLSVL